MQRSRMVVIMVCIRQRVMHKLRIPNRGGEPDMISARVGWLHRIPGTRASEGLLTSEHVCRQPKTEMHMDKMNAVVLSAVRCLNKWSFKIVIILSILHIGLAYIHVR